MFRTVRHWWSEGSGQHTARLFMFELTVVILGVLIAQGLANWVQARSSVQEMEQARSRFRLQLADNAVGAQAWLAAAPCLDARMAEIMDRLRTSSADQKLVDRPTFISLTPMAFDDRLANLLRERHGDDEAYWITETQRGTQFVNENSRQIIHFWGRLQLASSTDAPPTAFDREQARLAAADIRGELRALEATARFLLDRTKQLAVEPKAAEPSRPIRNCAEMWAKGAITFSP